jgi:hypothetical protein
MRRARLRRVNVFHCAATKSPQLPGVPFGWTASPETTVRAAHKSQPNEGRSRKPQNHRDGAEDTDTKPKSLH